MDKRRRKEGEKEEEEEVDRKEEAREIAVAIGGPIIKNQLTSQLPYESQLLSARNRKRLFWNNRSWRAHGETSSHEHPSIMRPLGGKEALCFVGKARK